MQEIHFSIRANQQRNEQESPDVSFGEPLRYVLCTMWKIRSFISVDYYVMI